MKKKQIKHFVPIRLSSGNWGYPVCRCYHNYYGSLVAIGSEFVITRKYVTCENCKRTKSFRKIK